MILHPDPSRSQVRTSKVFLRDSTMVSPYPLLLFGGELKVKHAQQLITVDKCEQPAGAFLRALAQSIFYTRMVLILVWCSTWRISNAFMRKPNLNPDSSGSTPRYVTVAYQSDMPPKPCSTKSPRLKPM